MCQSYILIVKLNDHGHFVLVNEYDRKIKKYRRINTLKLHPEEKFHSRKRQKGNTAFYKELIKT